MSFLELLPFCFDMCLNYAESVEQILKLVHDLLQVFQGAVSLREAQTVLLYGFGVAHQLLLKLLLHLSRVLLALSLRWTEVQSRLGTLFGGFYRYCRQSHKTLFDLFELLFEVGWGVIIHPLQPFPAFLIGNR